MSFPTSAGAGQSGGGQRPATSGRVGTGAVGGKGGVRLSRLRRSPDIRAVLQGGRRYAGGLVVVYVRPSERGVRAGFVCARTVGGAVARNRARRLMREGARVVLPFARGPHDVVIAARPEIRGAKAQDVTADMLDALRAARVVEG